MNGKAIIVGIILALATSAAFGLGILALTLFTQHAPQVQRATVLSGCDTLQVLGSVPPLGTSGIVKFNCGNGGAFTVSGNPSSKPTFNLPSGYTSLGIVDISHDCGGPEELALTSGNAISLVETTYDYCAHLDSTTATLVSFDIVWTV